MKKSRVVSLKKAGDEITGFFREISNDKVTVYAAQASFFVIISSVPFLILILSFAKYFVDVEWLVELVESRISGKPGDLVNTVINEVLGKGGIPLLSVSILTVFLTS